METPGPFAFGDGAERRLALAQGERIVKKFFILNFLNQRFCNMSMTKTVRDMLGAAAVALMTTLPGAALAQVQTQDDIAAHVSAAEPAKHTRSFRQLPRGRPAFGGR